MMSILAARLAVAAAVLSCPVVLAQGTSSDHSRAERPRARDIGIAPGVLRTGPLNAITDVAGVLVGQVTVNKGARIRTGVTVVVPHPGNLYQDKVPAGIAIGNAYGKFAGATQIDELGEIETPIALTNTLAVPAAAAGLIAYTLHQPGNEAVKSVNAVVGETNDGDINDIREPAIQPEHVLEALAHATSGPVEEGSVGAGRGTILFGWKGGIGTSSRRLPKTCGAYTVGVLVQGNYGGVLSMQGAPVGVKLDRYFLKEALDRGDADGSVIIVIATDAPLSDRNLKRLARRAFLGIARTGSPMTNGSGDYAVAFSTAQSVRRTAAKRSVLSDVADLPNEALSPLFEAVVEATEEAVYNALLRATTTQGVSTVEALPIERVRQILKEHGVGAAR